MLTMLKYVNLRRGSYIVAFIGAWALTPWNILASASALLNFMDGYTIWLAPITGVLLTDYWIVQQQQYYVQDLYQPHARYRYNKFGVNWRAMAAWCAGWVPLMPGFVNAVSSHIEPLVRRLLMNILGLVAECLGRRAASVLPQLLVRACGERGGLYCYLLEVASAFRLIAKRRGWSGRPHKYEGLTAIQLPLPTHHTASNPLKFLSVPCSP